MSEYLLESGNGGSIADVAYNPCGVSSTSQLLYKEFLDNLFRHGERCLGRAVFAAKCSIIARYPTDDNFYGPAVLWTLLGDPALRIKHRILSGVEDNPKPQARDFNLTITPSLASGSVTIRCPSTWKRDVCLSLCDASGRIVMGRQFEGGILRLDCGRLASGVYVARCVSGVNSASARLLVRHR